MTRRLRRICLPLALMAATGVLGGCAYYPYGYYAAPAYGYGYGYGYYPGYAPGYYGGTTLAFGFGGGDWHHHDWHGWHGHWYR